MSDQPPDPLPPGEDLARREPHESPPVWRPPWLRETPTPDDIEIRGPSEERAEALRALLEFPAEQSRSRTFFIAASPFIWMMMLGAVVTAGIGVVARTSMPASVLQWLPDMPLRDVSEPTVVAQAEADATEAAAMTPPGRAMPAVADGRDTEAETAQGPAQTSSPRDDGEAESSDRGADPSSGGIDVRTSAPGVWVEIEGVAQGRAPLRVSKLLAGPYVLRVTRPEGSVAQTIYVVGGEVTRIHVPGAQRSQTGPVLATVSESMPESSTFAAMPSSRIELPVFVLDDPPVIPTGDTEPAGDTGSAERASSPPEPVNERLPPIPAPFPRPDGARIVLDLTIDAGGRVQTINVRRSDDHSVNATVVSAARQWRYRPATRNGVSVPSVRTVDIPLSVK